MKKKDLEKKRKEEKSKAFLEGEFLGNSKGFGFVRVEDRENDFYISERDTMHAFHGDIVRIEPYSTSYGDRPEARVIGIVEHAVVNVVGTYEIAGDYGFVICDDRRISVDIYVPKERSMEAKDGAKVLCHITSYGSVNRNPEGEITQVLGMKGEPGVDILSVIYDCGIPMEFPEDVLAEAKKVNKKVGPSERKGRLDLRNTQMVTIDGEDSKDLDDAISIEKRGSGYVLGVHIADVSHYVREDSPLDMEARRRATSVYLLDRVIPMLPEELSNGICSLNQGEDRLALSCIMDLDRMGRVTGYEIRETVVRIDRRMTYKAVDAVLAGDKNALAEHAEFVPMFKLMEELSKKIRKRRSERGAVDFEFPETVIELDGDGTPIDVHPYERGVSSRIIEDFMLSANETVARDACDAEIPFVYRVHDFPNADKLESLKHVVAGFGLDLRGDLSQIHPQMIADLVRKVQGTPQELLVSTLTLRSMQQAIYDTECSGHFGLAAPYYCHYTSPIRRYPDLQSHRILKERIHGKLSAKRKSHYEAILSGICQVSSKNERRAEGAEREVERIKKAEYMEHRIGEEFTGHISGVTGWGLYVELENGIEGLVPVRLMKDDHYDFVEETYELVGRSKNRHFCLGDPMRISVYAVDPALHTIDFIPVEEEEKKRGKARRKKAHCK